MFSHCYQSGNPIELYNGHDKSLYSKWKFTGRNSKVYDPILKNYMHLLDIGTLSKMELPKHQRGINKSLGIFQSYIVFQVYLFSSKQFSIEIAISDTTKTKRRLIFSSNNSDLVFNQLHCRIPIMGFPIGKWVNFSIDILSFVGECFKDLTFRSIDYICLSMSGKVREIFTMRTPLSTLEGNSELFSSKVPEKFAIPSGENINMNCNRVISQIYIENQMNIMANSNTNRKEQPTIKFGGNNIGNISLNKDNKKFTFGKIKSASVNRMGNIGSMIIGPPPQQKNQELNNQREFVNVNSVSGEYKNKYKFFNKDEYNKKITNNKSVAGHIKRSLNYLNNNNSKWDSSMEEIGAFDSNGAVNIMNQISTIKNENQDDKSDYEIPIKDFTPQQIITENQIVGENGNNNNKKKIIEAILEDSSHFIFQKECSNNDSNSNNNMNNNNEDDRPFSPPITKM